MTSRAYIVILVLLFLSTPAIATAYTTITDPPSHWLYNFEVDEVPWVLNSAGCPDMTFDETLSFLESSFQTWEDVDCATIGFNYEGTTDQESVGNDGVNLMVWRTDGWNYGWGALGITGTWFGLTSIMDADIEFNADYHEWSDTGLEGTIDLQSVATHEIGHLLGLDHTEDPYAVMFPTYPGGTYQRTLADDDRSGVCYLYPIEGGGCSTELDCPPGHDCQAGDCVPREGGVVCDPCVANEQCGEEGDLCVAYSSGPSRCGAACGDDDDCEAAPGCAHRLCVCTELSDGVDRQCVASGYDCEEEPECVDKDQCADDEDCVDGECVPGGCTPFGDPCENREDCCTGYCIEERCSRPCDWLTPNESCPDDFHCMIQECGVGVCMPGNLGGAETGDSCDEHYSCSTGYCASTGGEPRCQLPCDPDGINSCPSEWSCLRIGASSCGLCACQIGMLGDPCEELGDCASGLCATKSGDRRCSRLCGDENPCPDGNECLDAGTRSICWPSKKGLGAECTDEADCVDGLCLDGNCTRNCESACDCPVGFECAHVSGQLACLPAMPAGEERGCEGCRTTRSSSSATLPLSLMLLLLTLFIFRRRK